MMISSMPGPYCVRAMTGDCGRAGARVIAVEQTLDADDQLENPETPSAALAEEFATTSATA